MPAAVPRADRHQFGTPRLRAALLALCVALISASQAFARQPQILEGTLTIVWADDPRGNRSEIRYSLHLPDGRTVALQMPGNEVAAVSLFGRRVIVTGTSGPQQAAGVAPSGGVLVVDSIAPADPREAADSRAVLGTRKVIYLLLKFASDSTVPHPPSFFTDMTNPDTAPPAQNIPTTLNAFFKKTSYNQFSWVGDVGGVGGLGAPGGWMTLPFPRSHYVPCGPYEACLQFEALGDDALALGRAQGIDFHGYDNINFVVSNDLDCCAWGGGYYSDIEDKFYGATWEPPWGQQAGTYVHEMGHSLGLPHSGWVYSGYDSPWDMMSWMQGLNNQPCGTYLSANNSNVLTTIYCFEPADGYITPHIDHLGWLPPANVVTIPTASVATVTLEAQTLPLGTGIKLIKICLPGLPCTGDNAHTFTVEARVKGLGPVSQYDNDIPGEGVLIHEFDRNAAPTSGTCFVNNTSGWAKPVDATPGDYDGAPACNWGSRVYPEFALFNAQFKVGQTYVNSAFDVSVTVVSRSGSSFVVTVANNAAPAIAGHPAAQTVAPGQAALLSVSATGQAPFAYQWYQGATGSTIAPIAGATASNYTTPPLSSSSRFWARVSNAYGIRNSNDALVTVTFTDNVLVAGGSMIRAVHVLELRNRINTLRARFGLGAYAWTQSLVAGATIVLAGDFAEMRSALLQAYAAAVVSAPTFTDASLTGLAIARVHLEELRSAVQYLESR